MNLFIAPMLVAALALGAVLWWGGTEALFLAAVLAVLEVTLSFDNAVINAKVLKGMSAAWQRRFLTWGMVISVFGTRLVLPILIVSAVTLTAPLAVAWAALYDPAQYAALLSGAEAAIKAFGGGFLLMVSLKFFFDAEKEVHWLGPLESRLARWGKIEAIEMALVLLALLGISLFSHDGAAVVLGSGVVGIALFVAMDSLTHGLGVEAASTAKSGILLFAYLNALDSAFSLDGVLGAFAITESLPVILAGLGIGAYFVRSLTVYLVRRGILASLRYLEHGAHWAIFGLAACMLAGLIVHVPETFTASVGLGLITLSYLSSRRAQAA